MNLAESIEIAVPPQDVFAYRLDFAANLASYNPNVGYIAQTAGNAPGPGSTYRLRLRAAPGLRVTTTIEVIEAHLPERIVNTASMLGFTVTEQVSIFSSYIHGRPSARVSFTVTSTPTHLLWRISDPIMAFLGRRHCRAELANMKRNLESHTPPRE